MEIETHASATELSTTERRRRAAPTLPQSVIDWLGDSVYAVHARWRASDPGAGRDPVDSLADYVTTVLYNNTLATGSEAAQELASVCGTFTRGEFDHLNWAAVRAFLLDIPTDPAA
jgi:hypothetical protein